MKTQPKVLYEQLGTHGKKKLSASNFKAKTDNNVFMYIK